MADTFDIRFAPSSGFASLFEPPKNVFRWKGAGVLRVDAGGIQIVRNRGLSSWLGGKRSHRIPVENLREVYREAHALRIEFGWPGVRGAVLPLWARDAKTAADIVKLLPTTHTIELDDDVSTRQARPAGGGSRGVTGLLTAIALLGGIAIFWTSQRRPAASPPSGAVIPVRATHAAAPPSDSAATSNASTPEHASPEKDPTGGDASLRAAAEIYLNSLVPKEQSSELPSLSRTSRPTVHPNPVSPENTVKADEPRPPAPPSGAATETALPPVVPISRNSAGYEIARNALTRFETESQRIIAAYQSDRDRFASGRLTRIELADKLAGYEDRWWSVNQWLFEEAKLDEPLIIDFWTTMVSAAQHWRRFLQYYETALRGPEGDPYQQGLATARFELDVAEEMQNRARQYLPE